MGSMSQYKNSRRGPEKEPESGIPVVCGGAGDLEKTLELALQDRDIHVFRDNSSQTLLSQLRASGEIPEGVFRSLVDIYTYFLDMSADKGDAPESAGQDG